MEEHKDLLGAVAVIKTAIMQSQARAVKGVNQEQLALYYGIGRFISVNTRKQNWGTSVIEGISERLRAELPGLRGFSASSLKNMRLFYEAWNMIESNSPIRIGELSDDTNNGKTAIQIAEIRQLQLTNLPDFPIAEFLSIGFTHHIRIIESTKTLEERLFYIRYCNDYKVRRVAVDYQTAKTI